MGYEIEETSLAIRTHGVRANTSQVPYSTTQPLSGEGDARWEQPDDILHLMSMMPQDF